MSVTDLGLVAAAAEIAAGRLSPVELTQAYLERIEAESLNAWVTVTPEQALADARRAADEVARGIVRGPLHGIPVGVKDLIDTAGVRTTYGSAVYAEHVPDRDATVVRRLREGGAVLLGKQATHELAWGGRTDSAFHGPTRNPHDPARIPGGSSGGGAAAVAAGSCLGAVGTDTAGSVRIPAALSGCVGLKPTRGRVPLDGIMPLAHSLDHVGTLARSVDDAAALLSVLLDSDGVPRAAAVPRRVGRLRGWPDELLDAGVAAAVDAAAEALAAAGVDVVDVDLGEDHDVVECALIRLAAEACAVHHDAFTATPAAFGADLADLLELGTPPAGVLAHADAVVARAGARLLDGLSDVDLLLLATVPVPAPEIGAMSARVGARTLPVELVLTRLTSIANVTGLPAASVPWGTVDGLPVGVQLVGRRYDDVTVWAGSRLLEDLSPTQP